jgi:hypothetical protein
LKVGILLIAVGETEAVPIAMDHDVDVVGIVVGRCRPVEALIVEMPIWRPLPP